MYAVKIPPIVAQTRKTHTLAFFKTIFTSLSIFVVGPSVSGTYILSKTTKMMYRWYKRKSICRDHGFCGIKCIS